MFCLILTLVLFRPFLHGSSQEQDKYEVNPTPDPTSIYKIYVPTNLEDAFVEYRPDAALRKRIE